MAKFCSNCGNQVDEKAYICVKCGFRIVDVNQVNVNNNAKSKVVAGLFGIFLGVFGVHNFYLGYTDKAIAQLLISLLSCGIFAVVSSVWVVIEGIMILSGSIDKDANGNLLKD